MWCDAEVVFYIPIKGMKPPNWMVIKNSTVFRLEKVTKTISNILLFRKLINIKNTLFSNKMECLPT